MDRILQKKNNNKSDKLINQVREISLPRGSPEQYHRKIESTWLIGGPLSADSSYLATYQHLWQPIK